MSSKTSHIRFQDFEPSKEQVSKVSKAIQKLQKLMPEGTKVQSFIRYEGKSFLGDLKFKSKWGSFMAEARGKNIIQVYARLKGKILKQWRAKKTAMENKKHGSKSKRRQEPPHQEAS